MKYMLMYQGHVRLAGDQTKPYITPLRPSEIEIGDNRILAVDPENVEVLVESYQATRQITPLMVRVILGQQADPAEPQDVRFVLIAGLNRLTMAMQLKLPKVPCNLIECTDDEAIELEVRENRDRRQLHGEQFRKLTMRLVELRGQGAGGDLPCNGATDKGGEIPHPLPTEVEVHSVNAQPHDRGISVIASELGVDRKAVREAVKIETQVTPEAKEAAREAGLIDNNSAMLEVASAPPEEQPIKVEEIAAKKRKPATQRGTAAQGNVA
jgi:ParB family chromosome partitioning protein